MKTLKKEISDFIKMISKDELIKNEALQEKLNSLQKSIKSTMSTPCRPGVLKYLSKEQLK